MEHFFTTYVRTKTVSKHRLNDLKDYDTVKIYVFELKKLGVNDGPLLYRLKSNGEISYDDKGNFKALKDGPVDFSLLEVTKRRVKVKAPLTPLHEYMRHQLLFVDVDVERDELSVYFKAFLDHRHRQIGSFFSVDAFAGRVHTPVVNLKGDLRHAIRLHGEKVVSLDVKQMQPTILAKVLFKSVGKNSFSDAIFTGKDVYVLLQGEAGLNSRPEAKKLLFQLIFGKPMTGIGKMFKGDTRWVDWINKYKSVIEERNPHKEDKHTNLAWLLQYSEVQVMTDIWRRLMDMAIPFLTIHDDVMCRKRDKNLVYDVMREELKRHFNAFNIIVTE